MADIKKPSEIDQKLRHKTDPFGNLLVDLFHYLILFAIGGAVVWSAAHEYLVMVERGKASIQDILLLFIYLELGAMVGIYFKTNHMPTRFLVYVGITALTRMLLGDIQAHHLDPGLGIVYISGSILLLSVANLIVRYGSHRYPSSIPGITAPPRKEDE